MLTSGAIQQPDAQPSALSAIKGDSGQELPSIPSRQAPGHQQSEAQAGLTQDEDIVSPLLLSVTANVQYASTQPTGVPLDMQPPPPTASDFTYTSKQLTKSRLLGYFRQQLPELVRELQGIARAERTSDSNSGQVLEELLATPLTRAELLALSQYFLRQSLRAPIVEKKMSLVQHQKQQVALDSLVVDAEPVPECPWDVEYLARMNAIQPLSDADYVRFASVLDTLLSAPPRILPPCSNSNMSIFEWLYDHPEPDDYETAEYTKPESDTEQDEGEEDPESKSDTEHKEDEEGSVRASAEATRPIAATI